MAESLDDLLMVQDKPAYKKRLEAIKMRTPFLISVLNAEESFPEWGRFGLLSHTWKYKVRGSEIKERWGVPDVKDGIEYQVHDFMDLENRLIWADEITLPFLAKPHNSSMSIVTRYAGGSSLFHKPEEQMQSFLYAKAKGELDKRENLVLTAVFTSIFLRGLPGPLYVIDPDNYDATNPPQVNYQGPMRYMVAKAQQMREEVVDGNIVQIKNMLDELSESSTIRSATLGDNISGSTFSALSMMSSAGKLPMIDPREAVEGAFSDIFLHILERIKEQGIANDLIQPLDIPDNVEVEVTLEPKLPQDNLRNAQVAQNLGDLVSDEWKHSNLLQIGNSKEMHRQSMKEQIFKALVGYMINKPEVMDSLLQSALGTPPQQPQQGPPPDATMPSQPPPQGEVPPGYHQMPDGSMMSDAGMQAQGQGQPGMEQMPQTGPMIPPQERM